MSNQNSWAKRLETYRYSQDERMLTYKFEKELTPAFDKLVGMADQKALVLGPYDLAKEPWRYAGVQSLARKYNFKVTDREVDGLVEYIITKKSLSKQRLA